MCDTEAFPTSFVLVWNHVLDKVMYATPQVRVYVTNPDFRQGDLSHFLFSFMAARQPSPTVEEPHVFEYYCFVSICNPVLPTAAGSIFV